MQKIFVPSQYEYFFVHGKINNYKEVKLAKK